MSRYLWREDFEQRAAIRAAKDADPDTTVKKLHIKFGVSTNIISAALEKTVDEWKALAVATPYRTRLREPTVLIQESVQVPSKGEAPNTDETDLCIIFFACYGRTLRGIIR
nr:hypothetical protein [Candidatus Sigynarchaeota archaeon]